MIVLAYHAAFACADEQVPVARPSFILALCLFALSSVWPQTTAAQAEPPPFPQPSAATPPEAEPPQSPPPAAEPAPERRRWVMPPPETAEEQGAAPRGEQVDLAGDVWLEIAGGVMGMLVGGGALIGGLVLALDSPGQNCGGGCTVLLAGGVIGVFLGPALGVTIAGDATGGQGSFGYALLGTVPGILLSLPGMVAGALIGYRASAPDAPKQDYRKVPRASNGVLLIDVRF